jgi:hypothetical protein
MFGKESRRLYSTASGICFFSLLNYAKYSRSPILSDYAIQGENLTSTIDIDKRISSVIC